MTKRYSAVVMRYLRDPIYVENPEHLKPMSQVFRLYMADTQHMPDMLEYGDFVGDPRQILAIADNQTPRHTEEM